MSAIHYQWGIGFLLYVVWMLYGNQLLTPRKSQRSVGACYLCCAIYDGAVWVLELFYGTPTILNVILHWAGPIGACLIAYQGPVRRKCFIILSEVVTWTFGEILISLLVQQHGNLQEKIWLTYLPVFAMAGMLQILLLVCTLFIIKRNIMQMSPKTVIRFLVFPCSQLIMFGCLNWLILDQSVPVMIQVTVVFVVVSIAADIVLMLTVNQVSNQQKLELQNFFLEQQEPLQRQHFEAMQQQYNGMQKLCQGMVAHLLEIQRVMQENAEQELKNLTAEVVQNYENQFHTLYCRNRVVDAILFDQLERAKQHNIQVHTEVSIPSNCSVEDVDLICIFSNLLENANEACEHVPVSQNRYLEIRAFVSFGNLVITVTNAYEDKARENLHEPRKQRQHFGLGHTILRTIAKKYNGTLTINKTPLHYHVEIVLPLEEEEPLITN